MQQKSASNAITENTYINMSLEINDHPYMITAKGQPHENQCDYKLVDRENDLVVDSSSIHSAVRLCEEEESLVCYRYDSKGGYAERFLHYKDPDKYYQSGDFQKRTYVAVQSGIDEVKNCNVFVLATANEMWKLPSSLVRSGRFDRKIEVQCPTAKDADEIIKHYLSDKKVAENVDMDDLSKMISYSSCAELETILNEAAISAAHARKSSIEMDDFVKSVLRMQYDSPDNFTKTSAEDMKKTALHEAGHLVVSEILCPGSVGLASLRSTGRDSTGGFIHRCKELSRRPHYVLVSLAGKAAVELYYSDTVASGCTTDINRAFNCIRDGISENATLGFGMIDVSTDRFPKTSEDFKSRNEAVTHAELERYMIKARDILLKNRDFLEKATAALIEKETLLHSDVKKIRESSVITDVAV